MSRIRIVQQDITRLAVDVIVNAANSSLLGGGGCPTGEACITDAFELPARWVVHTVGPVWNGGGKGEPELLRSCYRNAFSLARGRGAVSIAFPAISTGVYGYPKRDAAQIAVDSMREADGFEEIVACCFSAEDAALYREMCPECSCEERL